MRTTSRTSTPAARGIADFFHADDRMAALIPAVTRIAALQKDCAAILPAIFETCFVLHLDDGRLSLATPSSAMAAKLKQQVPKLQDALQKLGWQVSAIRIKVQPGNISKKISPAKQLTMPTAALSALAQLHASLDNSAQNERLKFALSALVQRHSMSK